MNSGWWLTGVKQDLFEQAAVEMLHRVIVSPENREGKHMWKAILAGKAQQKHGTRRSMYQTSAIWPSVTAFPMKSCNRTGDLE